MDIGRTLPPDIAGQLLSGVLSDKALYEALIKVVYDAVIELSGDGRIERWNLPAEALTGATAQSAVGKNLRDFVAEGELDALTSLPADGQPHELRLTFIDTGGKRVPVRGCAVGLKTRDHVDGWILTCMPAPRLNEIEQLKSEFVSSVSHELKTPLATIKAYAVTLLGSPDDGVHRAEYLRIIDQQADRLSRLIDDLLLVTRVEAGHMLKRRVRAPLSSVLERVLAKLTFDPEVHPVEIKCDGVRVSGDPDRLVDIFTHLIENAIKYSPAGGTISVSAAEADGKTTVTVRDNGIGIEGENLPFIFDRFYRVDSNLTSRVGGSGLGLFLVNALVRAHGGTVEVRSEPGKGTAFTLALPVRE